MFIVFYTLFEHSIATVIVKTTIVKTMIVNIVAMIGVNHLVIERRKM